MNGSSEKRIGTATNCAQIAVDNLDIIPDVILDETKVTYGALVLALSKYCKIIPVEIIEGVTVEQFWRTHTDGRFLLVYRNPSGSYHVSAVRNGSIFNTTTKLLCTPLAWVDQVLAPVPQKA